MKHLITIIGLFYSVCMFAQNKTVTVDYYNMGEIQMLAEQGRIMNEQENRRIREGNVKNAENNHRIIKDILINKLLPITYDLKVNKELHQKNIDNILNESLSLVNKANKRNYGDKLRKLEAKVEKEYQSLANDIR